MKNWKGRFLGSVCYSLLLLVTASCSSVTGATVTDSRVTEDEKGEWSHIKAMQAGCLPAGFTQKHDAVIKKAWIKHLPPEWGDRHCGFRAGLMAESSGNEKAVSYAGAVGLGQQLVTAAEDCQKKGKLKGTRADARFSANCGAWLYNRNRKIWISPRPKDEHIILTRASYITGAGNLLAAQKVATKEGYAALLYSQISPFLPRVISKKNATDVQHYIDRIAKLEKEMTP